ncbi:serine protease 7-like [Anticarsia gemmatalis]|uniref:serine protease 7-like n=1 Tax=Anticarsia gemmatalis TaxID=129554 RepID=UPI003F765F75
MIRSIIVLLCVVGVWSFTIKEPNCGIEASTNLIHHNPWVVYLEYWRDGVKTGVRCTATLIDSRHIITAAHCIRTPKYTRLVARLGEYDLTSDIDCVDGVCGDPIIRLEVIDTIVHPDYDNSDHDIAILKLEADVAFTDFIRPVCLPSGRLQPEITFAASGWGEIPHKGYYSDIKKIIPLPLWKREDCLAAYKNFNVPAHVICAGGQEDVDTCRGDSGGPLVWVQKRVELWGVTSAGNVNCGTKNSPGLYTNVAEHLDWILTVLELSRARD